MSNKGDFYVPLYLFKKYKNPSMMIVEYDTTVEKIQRIFYDKTITKKKKSFG
jgi:hypothetical protein